MHRLTARILLVMLLVSVFAPVALASVGPPQHACCLRKAMRCHEMQMPASGPGFSSQIESQGRGNCCPPMATPHWAYTAAQQTVFSVGIAVPLRGMQQQMRPTATAICLHSVRGPPQPAVA